TVAPREATATRLKGEILSSGEILEVIWAQRSSIHLSPDLLEQPAEEEPLRRVAGDDRDGIDQRDLLRTDFVAVLGLAAIGHAAIAHHRVETDVLVHGPGRVQIEEPHLVDGGRADERRGVVVLGAGFQAATAGHAARERVALLLVFG